MIIMFVLFFENIISNPDYLLSMFAVLVALVALIVIMVYLIHNRNIKIVKSTSLMYEKLIGINQYYIKTYKKIYHKNEYIFNHVNKYSFDRDTVEGFLSRIIDQNYDEFKTLVENTKNNQISYGNYIDAYLGVRKYIGLTEVNRRIIKSKKYIKFEETIYENEKLISPKISFNIATEIRYASPQGRNSYKQSRVFNYEEVKKALSYYEMNREYLQALEKEKGYERSKMTSKLRLEIIERDGRKCTICGRGIEDGIKLHVDHIIPVSKGGKTSRSNLRTLCDECNLGKSARILENDNVDDIFEELKQTHSN